LRPFWPGSSMDRIGVS